MVFDETNQNLAVVAKFQTWMDGTVVNVLENNTISQFIEKKDFDILKTDIYYKTVNIYKFSKKFIKNEYVPFLKAFMQAYGKNEYYETALKIIVHLYRTPLKAFILDEQKWYEIDNKQDWEIATELFKND
jgi:NDP-sugar pyrophosphorylase family protein